MTTKWYQQTAPGTHSLTEVAHPDPVHGSRVGRLERRNGETLVGYQHPKLSGTWPLIPGGHPTGNGPLDLGEEIKAGLGVYVPLDYPTDAATDRLLQIISTPDPTPATTPNPDFSLLRAPMLDLAIVDGITWRWQGRSDAVAYPGQNPTPTPVTHHTSTILKGEWTYWTLEWKSAIDGTGYFRLHKAVGEAAYTQVVNYTGATAYNATYAGFVRLALDLGA